MYNDDILRDSFDFYSFYDGDILDSYSYDSCGLLLDLCACPAGAACASIYFQHRQIWGGTL